MMEAHLFQGGEIGEGGQWPGESVSRKVELGELGEGVEARRECSGE